MSYPRHSFSLCGVSCSYAELQLVYSTTPVGHAAHCGGSFVVKYFQVLVDIADNSIQHHSFVCTQFVLFDPHIEPYQVLQTGPRRIGNEGLLHIPQIPKARASLSDCLMSWPSHSFGSITLLQRCINVFYSLIQVGRIYGSYFKHTQANTYTHIPTHTCSHKAYSRQYIMLLFHLFISASLLKESSIFKKFCCQMNKCMFHLMTIFPILKT